MTRSGNSLRQTVYTHRASVHQAAKLVAALLRVARVTAGLAESNCTYPLVYDSRHLQADCQEPGSALDTLGNQVWATFYTPAFYSISSFHSIRSSYIAFISLIRFLFPLSSCSFVCPHGFAGPFTDTSLHIRFYFLVFPPFQVFNCWFRR